MNHLGPGRWETVCGSPSENWSANPASVTCPDCMADDWLAVAESIADAGSF